MVLAVDWGDVPTWLSSGVALLALLFAAAAIVAARRTFQIESERDRVNAALRRDQDAYARRAHAARVSAWWASNDGSGSHWGVFVRNASDAPVYQAHATVASRRDGTMATKIDLPVIPPTDAAVFHELQVTTGGVAVRPALSMAEDLRVKLTFTDASGVRWMRDEYGRLVELNHKLQVWVHERIGSVLERFAAEFHGAYGVTVNFQTNVFRGLQVRFVEQAERARASGTGWVDVLFAPHDWIGNLVREQAIEHLVISDADRDYFDERALAAMSYRGVLYGLPAMMDTIALYRNLALAPEAPATIEDMLATGAALRDAGRAAVPLALQVGQHGDPFHLHPLFTSAGGWVFGLGADGTWDLDTVGVAQPESIAALRLLQSLGEQGSGVLRRDIDERAAQQLFLDQQAPFLITTSWGAARTRRAGVPFEVSAVPPFENGRDPELLVSVNGFLVASQSGNQALALDLLADFLTRPDVTWALADHLVAVPAARQCDISDPVIEFLATQCAAGRPMPAHPQMRVVWQLLGAAQAEIVAGADVSRVAHRLATDLAGAVSQG